MSTDRLTTILVVDDDRLVRITMCKILESAGYTVFEAKDGAEAIEVFRKRRPDLVILDIVMPIKDGVRTFLELRGIDSKSRIIAMSAGARSGKIDYLSLTKRIGANGILTKPFNRASVLAMVGQILLDEKSA
ncbi:MAG TPA: response regulator [Dongiaceae bacterium]|jgi:two-component system chemotaxis response regulator CheY|nr:response regulator [Dongiaceae bacterium]